MRQMGDGAEVKADDTGDGQTAEAVQFRNVRSAAFHEKSQNRGITQDIAVTQAILVLFGWAKALIWRRIVWYLRRFGA